ncbi:MAG: hypothetical protein AAF989_13170 [Planctomycetota bacterium]
MPIADGRSTVTDDEKPTTSIWKGPNPSLADRDLDKKPQVPVPGQTKSTTFPDHDNGAALASRAV